MKKKKMIPESDLTPCIECGRKFRRGMDTAWRMCKPCGRLQERAAAAIAKATNE